MVSPPYLAFRTESTKVRFKTTTLVSYSFLEEGCMVQKTIYISTMYIGHSGRGLPHLCHDTSHMVLCSHKHHVVVYEKIYQK